MFRDKKVVVIMPAFNAEKTLEQTVSEVREQECVDQIIVVDDESQDRTVQIAESLGDIKIIRHPKNVGYGGNQKTCYEAALREGADIVVMVHPDYQYTPKLIPAMVALIGNGLYHCVLASRVLGGHAIRGGMPFWRYAANRFLTLTQNLLLREKISEYHTGYRAFSRKVLEQLPLPANSDDFVFDNQMLAQVLWHQFVIAEISCPTKYATESSSIGFLRSVKYGFGCLNTCAEFLAAKFRIIRSARFPINPQDI